MPPVLIDLILFVAGCSLGTIVNWSTYRLAYLNPRRTSPWSRLRDPRTKAIDLIPVVGWWFQRRWSSEFGAGFWVRPLLIELACGVALPLFSLGVHNGILTACSDFVLPPPNAPQQAIWVAFFFTLGLLLTAATFIDFDEKTIPDEITLTGTLLALLVACFVPPSRLPNVDVLNPGLRIGHLQFSSPYDLPAWHREFWGIALVAAIVLIWVFALLPKTITFRWGFTKGIRFMWASLWRRPRLRSTGPNETPPINIVNQKVICVLAFFLIIFSAIFWWQQSPAWDALFGAWMGFAFGGGLVWSVRIIAGNALGKEAMGFGDVTLMGMIGAWLGWQPALLVFAIAPFAALFIALAQLLTVRHTEIAFGPYLSLGAIVVIVFWGPLWHDWAKFGIFALGPILLVITLICLVLMAAMLSGWRAIRDRWS